MESRYGDLGGLRDAAAEKGIELTEGDVRQAELAIFKKAYKYLEDNHLPSKMLSCSLRLGPEVNGTTRIWHLEEKTGASVVVTCPPSFIDQVINFEGEKDIVFEKNRIHADTPGRSWTNSCAFPISKGPMRWTATGGTSTTPTRPCSEPQNSFPRPPRKWWLLRATALKRLKVRTKDPLKEEEVTCKSES